MDQGTVAIVTSGVAAVVMLAVVVQPACGPAQPPADGPAYVEPDAWPLWNTDFLPPELMDKPRFYRAAQGVAADCLPKASVVLDCAEPPCVLVIRSRNEHVVEAVKRCPEWAEAFGPYLGVRRAQCGPGWLTMVYPPALTVEPSRAGLATLYWLRDRMDARFDAWAAQEGCEALGPEAPVLPAD